MAFAVESVKDHGAVGDGSDATVAFQDAIDAAVISGAPVWIDPGTYAVADLAVYSDVSIIAAGYNSIVRGVAGTDVLFSIVPGEIRRFTIDGGTWQSCTSVIKMQDTVGGVRSALHTCSFRNMRVHTIAGVAFALKTCVGCEFHRVDVDTCVGHAFEISVDAAESEFFTINHWSMCRFANLDAHGIYMGNESGSKTINSIERCWFESVDQHGIYIGRSVHSFTITTTYFSHCGDSSTDYHDIFIEDNGGIAPHGIKIDGCSFMNAAVDAARRRINVDGSGHVTVRDCKFMLHDAGQKCVKLANVLSEATLFDNTIVLSGGTVDDYLGMLLDGSTDDAEIRFRSI